VPWRRYLLMACGVLVAALLGRVVHQATAGQNVQRESPRAEANKPTHLSASIPRFVSTVTEQEAEAVAVDERQICQESRNCGDGTACIAGRCDACSADTQCAPKEVCLKGVCIKRERAGCHTLKPCDGSAACGP